MQSRIDEDALSRSRLQECSSRLPSPQQPIEDHAVVDHSCFLGITMHSPSATVTSAHNIEYVLEQGSSVFARFDECWGEHLVI